MEILARVFGMKKKKVGVNTHCFTDNKAKTVLNQISALYVNSL